MMSHIDLYRLHHNYCKLTGTTKRGNNIAYIRNVPAGVSMIPGY